MRVSAAVAASRGKSRARTRVGWRMGEEAPVGCGEMARRGRGEG